MENFFKDAFTKDEVDELLAWFDEHRAELPQSLVLDKSQSTQDLPKTVERMVTMVRRHAKVGSSVYNGYIATLMMIRHLVSSQKQ